MSIGSIFSGNNNTINIKHDTLAQAIAKKTGNASISATTDCKLRTLASSLYAIGNLPDMGSRLRGLDKAATDIAAANELVAQMVPGRAKNILGSFLEDTGKRFSRLNKKVTSDLDPTHESKRVQDLENKSREQLLRGARARPPNVFARLAAMERANGSGRTNR